jgi:hypothetical protein
MLLGGRSQAPAPFLPSIRPHLTASLTLDSRRVAAQTTSNAPAAGQAGARQQLCGRYTLGPVVNDFDMEQRGSGYDSRADELCVHYQPPARR